MTGIECLKEELLKKGFTRQQTESKICMGVLEIVSNSSGRYTDMNRILQEISELEKRKAKLEAMCREYTGTVSRLESRLAEIVAEVNKECDRRYKATTDAVTAFNHALEECETPEARDALKTAQTFINSVSIDTKYDNTAFIIGLASILAHGAVAPINELRKINDKIPQLMMEAYPWSEWGKPQKDYDIREKGYRRIT